MLELVSAKEMKSLVGQWDVERNDVGYLQEFIERFDSLDPQRLLVPRGDIGILEDTVKAKSLGTPGSGRADSPAANDTENLAA
jgi:hypothetical protein